MTVPPPAADGKVSGLVDGAAARRFYDAVLAPLGYRCVFDFGTALGYGPKHAEFWLGATEHPVPADDRSGLHISFKAPTRASVDQFHAAALEAGGRDNGAPGLRPDYGPGYYAVFFADPSGNRAVLATR